MIWIIPIYINIYMRIDTYILSDLAHPFGFIFGRAAPEIKFTAATSKQGMGWANLQQRKQLWH